MSEATQKIMESVTELRAEMTKAIPDMDKVEKMNAFLDTHEEKSQALLAEQVADRALATEQKERLDALEISLASRVKDTGKKHFRDSDEYKALQHFAKSGDFENMEQKALLRTDIDTQGGFLAPEEMDQSMVKKITEISAIRSIARVRTVSAKTLNIVVRNTIPDASYEGEAEEGTDDASTYSVETVTPFRLTVTVPITQDMLMDSAFNMESEIMGDAAEGFAKKEGSKFVNGSGSKQPHGFLADSRVLANFITSATSGAVMADDILKVTGELKTGYNASFVLNRRTLALLRTEKTLDGAFIWQPGINGVVQNSLAGESYLLAQDMPDVIANSYSVAYGDFLKGYTIVDRTGLSVVRDEYSQKRKAIVEFTLNKWNTGQVVLPEAITGIQTKA